MRGENLTTVAEFTVGEGERVPFVLTWFPSHRDLPDAIDAESARRHCAYWREWRSRCSYGGRYEQARAQLADGAEGDDLRADRRLVAAPTTSLPEQIGGIRNWDYRYCWLRDAAFALAALLENGFVNEAGAWRSWLLRAVAGDPDDLQIMYGPAGERRLTELELTWLDGYEVAAGAGRQRRERAVPARRLRRGTRRALRGPPPRPAPTRARGRSSGRCWRTSSGAGASRTRGSGRCAARAATSLTRR